MRFVKSLLMLLMLVTFSTGFGKTTTDLKQNSKTELSPFTFSASHDFVTVVLFTAVSNDATLFRSSEATLFIVKDYHSHDDLAIITDVGWQSFQKHYKEIPYSEKLLENYNLHFKSKLLSNINSVRGNC